jgi:hypothetical protein
MEAQRTEAKPKRSQLFLSVAVGVSLALGALLGWYARDFFAVNACLDAGGSWTNPGVCIGALLPR